MLAHERASLPRSSLHAAAYLCLAWARLTPARLPDHPSRAAPPCPAGGARPEAQGGLPERRRPALKLRLGPRGLCLQRRVGRQRRRVRQLARRAAAGARRRPQCCLACETSWMQASVAARTSQHNGLCACSTPFGPMDDLVIWESCLQASIFLYTASSRPEKCLCPSLSMAASP